MKYSLESISDTIKRFINDEISCYEWDDLISSKGDDLYDAIIDFCNSAQCMFPSENDSDYCSETGIDVLL